MRLTVPLQKSVTIRFKDGEEFRCGFEQPRQKDMIARGDLMNQMERFNPERGRAYDVYFLLRECDIESKDGKPLWNALKLKQQRLPLEAFMKGWDILPPEVAGAIWEAAMEVSPAWDWRKRQTEEGSFREWDSAPEPPEE